jgi:hypothetical protein
MPAGLARLRVACAFAALGRTHVYVTRIIKSLSGYGQYLISLNCVFDASLVPETCLEPLSLPVCLLDSIRQAKADIRHGASCPTISMAPVLAITSLVARTAL